MKIYYNNKKSFIWILFIALLTSSLVLASLFEFNSKMKHTVEQQMNVHLQEIAVQVGDSIDTEIDNCIREVGRLSVFLSNIKEPLDNSIIPILKDAADSSNISRFAVVTKDGMVINSSNINAVASDYRYGKVVFNGEQGISDVFISKATHQNVISVYAPIYRNSEIVAGVFGTIVIEELDDTVSFSGFGGEGYSYLIQSDGNTIMSTKHHNRLSGMVNFFEFLNSYARDVSLDSTTLKDRIKLRESGFIEYKVDEQERKLYYYPTKFKDWYVLSVVPQDVLNTYSSKLYRDAVTLITRVLSIFAVLFFTFMVWSYVTRKRLEQAHDDVLKSNRKYEIAIANTNHQIFDYSVAHDTLLDASITLCDALKINKSQLPLKKPFDTMFAPESLIYLRNMFKQALVSGENTFEIQNIDDKWLKISLSALKQDKETILIGTVNDISYFKEIQQQYAQEEQYFQALLGGSILGFSADLESGDILSFFKQGETKSDTEQRFKLLNSETINLFAANVHSEHRSLITKLYSLQNLRNIHQHGIRDLSEYFLLKSDNDEGYIWAAAKIHFLNSPQDGHALIFSYIKNVDEEMRRQLELEYRSEIDELTGLYNRATLVRKINSALVEPNNNNYMFLMTDLDGFKQINDTYGHQAGDRILRSFSNILRKCMGETSYIGRLGGDEFVVFKYGAASLEEVLREAHQVCRQIEELSKENYSRSVITVSIGVSVIQFGDTFESLYPRTDKILYRAKASGKNCVMTDDHTHGFCLM